MKVVCMLLVVMLSSLSTTAGALDAVPVSSYKPQPPRRVQPPRDVTFTLHDAFSTGGARHDYLFANDPDYKAAYHTRLIGMTLAIGGGATGFLLVAAGFVSGMGLTKWFSFTGNRGTVHDGRVGRHRPAGGASRPQPHEINPRPLSGRRRRIGRWLRHRARWMELLTDLPTIASERELS